MPILTTLKGSHIRKLLTTPFYLIYTYSNNRGTHSVNHTLLPDIYLQYNNKCCTVITEVHTLLTTPCYLIYTYSNNRIKHFTNHALLSGVLLEVYAHTNHSERLSYKGTANHTLLFDMDLVGEHKWMLYIRCYK